VEIMPVNEGMFVLWLDSNGLSVYLKLVYSIEKVGYSIHIQWFYFQITIDYDKYVMHKNSEKLKYQKH